MIWLFSSAAAKYLSQLSGLSCVLYDTLDLGLSSLSPTHFLSFTEFRTVNFDVRGGIDRKLILSIYMGTPVQTGSMCDKKIEELRQRVSCGVGLG